MRRLVCHVPDWPALTVPAPAPALCAVLEGGRVRSCSPAARALGVRTGLRRREAEAFAPGLSCYTRDLVREARAFEPLLRALGELATALEVSRPGLCSLATRGPVRYFGGESRLLEVVHERVAPLLPEEGRLELGVADTPFAALLGARRGLVIPPGGDAAFLAPFPITALGRTRLTELLQELGIETLGALASIDEGLVSGRFGSEGVAAWRAASAREELPLALSGPMPELVVESELDPPAYRSDTVSFVTRTLAEEFIERLSTRGLRCTRFVVTLESEHGEVLTRAWRAPRVLSPAQLTERVRWQLEGWLSGSPGSASPTGGISLVRIGADVLLPAGGDQLNLFEDSSRTPRDLGALDRLSALLGPEAVTTALLVGGRGPAERVALVAWGEERPQARATAPWPGHHRLPAPAVVYAAARACELVDEAGVPVAVNGRGAMRRRPARLRLEGGDRTVVAFAGPWLYEEEWWTRRARRRARLQVVLEDGAAHLLALEEGAWSLEASYD